VKNIITNPVSQTLKLRSRPTQAANGIITGEYQASYKKFYQKTDEGIDELRWYTVKIVFRCRVSGGIDSVKSLGGVDVK
jgi:hypothetical protein